MCIVTAVINSGAYQQAPLMDKWESMLYHRLLYKWTYAQKIAFNHNEPQNSAKLK